MRNGHIPYLQSHPIERADLHNNERSETQTKKFAGPEVAKTLPKTSDFLSPSKVPFQRVSALCHIILAEDWFSPGSLPIGSKFSHRGAIQFIRPTPQVFRIGQVLIRAKRQAEACF